MKSRIIFHVLLVFVLSIICQIAYCQANLGGMGAAIDIDINSKYPFIVSVKKGMPANEMNLAPNDYITKINGYSTYNYTMEQVILQLTGQIGTTCSITIWRNNVEYPLTFTRVSIKNTACNIYKNALPDFTEFEWSGGSNNGYAEGYGRLQLINNGKYASYYIGYMKAGSLDGEGIYYYSNGNKFLEGHFSNNQLNGNGKQYDSKGNLKIEGIFENDVLRNIESANKDFQKVSEAIVEDIFDGGTNIQSNIVGFRRYYTYQNIGDNNMIVEVKISFNGNIVRSNYYEVTLKIKNNLDGFSYEFIDWNDMATGYGITKATIKLGMLARKLEALRNK